MTVAWRRAELRLATFGTPLYEWALPHKRCIRNTASPHQLHIPISVWQTALPVWRAVLASTEEKNSRHASLDELLRQPLRSIWILARRDKDGEWSVEEEEDAEMSADVQAVEVLRDVDYERQVRKVMPPWRDVDVRCRLVLLPCPYLHHLHLTIDECVYEAPSHRDTFTLVPRLRSLHLEQHDSDYITVKPLFNFQPMLDSLPHLTSLRCTNIRGLGIASLLAIACHSTLDDLRIDSCHNKVGDEHWIGRHIHLPISSAEEDERRMRQEFRIGGNIGEEDSEAVEAALARHISEAAVVEYEPPPNTPPTDSEAEAGEVESTTAAIQRMRTALTRTQPTERSCRVRLALADWLHRRLRRGGLFSDDHVLNYISRHPRTLLFHYRLQVALLRRTLHSQLTSGPFATP